MFTILKSIVTDALQTVSLNFARVAYTEMNNLVVGESTIPDMAANIMTGDIFENFDVCAILSDPFKTELHAYNSMLAKSYIGPSAKIATWWLNSVTDTVADTVIEKAIESTTSYFLG